MPTSFKILCLHGIGTNSDIFEAQTAAIRYQLGDSFTYDFVEGAHPWPAAPGIDSISGDRPLCYSYFDGSAESALGAVQDLGDYIEENGPFDCVMGFSLGAAMAATLLLRPGEDAAARQIKSLVFLCGTLPCDWAELQRHKLRPLRVGGDQHTVIHIPSVHAWSPEDTEWPGQSEQLFQLCDGNKRVQVLHGAGHGIPSGGQEAGAIANAIRDMLARLE